MAEKKAKEKIAIYLGEYVYGGDWDERNLEKGRIGGSEVWAIEISKEFVRRGYDVYVFASPMADHVSESGVHYVTWDKFGEYCNTVGFDHIISSRRVDEIDDYTPCDSIYVMCHDTCVINANNYSDLKLDTKVKKICVQSYYQKYMLQSRYDISDAKFMATSEGIDMKRYRGASTVKKKNKMLWSSGVGRGIIWLVERVLPLIRAEVPDFEIDICGYYDDYMEPLFRQSGINVMGNVAREDLVRLQKESKIWIYPNHGLNSENKPNEETFSITAIENGAARNALILSDWGCWYTTLKGYEGFVGNGLFENPIIPMEQRHWDAYAKIIADRAIKCLTNETYRKKLADSAYDVSKKFTWAYAAESFEREWNKEKTENTQL